MKEIYWLILVYLCESGLSYNNCNLGYHDNASLTTETEFII